MLLWAPNHHINLLCHHHGHRKMLLPQHSARFSESMLHFGRNSVVGFMGSIHFISKSMYIDNVWILVRC
ncbi:unnamed protein product [Urochloa humidicola]